MKNTADVIIVGAGIVGNATAYYLVKSGSSVIVLEGDKNIGNGASSRNGGGVRQSGRDARELPLMQFGIKNIWPTISDEMGYDCEYHQDGNLRLGKTEKHLQILKRLADFASACGVEVKMIDGAEVRVINPYLSEEVIGASWCPSDGHANPMATTLAFYMASRRLGVRYYSGDKVVKLRKIKGQLRQVVTESGAVYEGDTVMLAAGYGSRGLAATVGIDVPIEVNLIEALVTETEPHMFNQMLGTAEADFYGYQTNHGSFVFGGDCGLEEFTEDPINRPNSKSNCSITAPCICRGIMKYFPDLAKAKIVRTWAGEEDKCVDLVPVLGTVEEVPGMILACGFTGHGFGIGPAVGNQLARLITEKKTDIDLSALHYNRFKAKI